jgi:hypothetical protein
MRTRTVTIVGGGLGGLVAAIAAREAGCHVVLHEARRELGGRARTAPAPYRANWGPHVVYSDGPLWAWLEARDLADPARHPPAVPTFALRVGGRAHAVPTARVGRALLRLRRMDAPSDRSFFEWSAAVLGDDTTARQIANFMGVATFDHDPGRLSAEFVNERLHRVTKVPLRTRYVPGGWATIVERLARRCRELGVQIATSSPVDSVPAPPVVLAVPMARAAALLGDATLSWPGTSTALLDVAVRTRAGDPFIVSDLDGAGFAEDVSRCDPSLVPDGERLYQCQAGLRPGEHLESGVARLEALLDDTVANWRTRETWRRRFSVEDESGALDGPGTSWRERPRGERTEGVHVVNDMVAAPGLLSEVSVHAALEAVSRLAGSGAAAETAAAGPSRR